jgi:hypothetical protein
MQNRFNLIGTLVAYVTFDSFIDGICQTESLRKVHLMVWDTRSPC